MNGAAFYFIKKDNFIIIDTNTMDDVQSSKSSFLVRRFHRSWPAKYNKYNILLAYRIRTVKKMSSESSFKSVVVGNVL